MNYMYVVYDTWPCGLKAILCHQPTYTYNIIHLIAQDQAIVLQYFTHYPEYCSHNTRHIKTLSYSSCHQWQKPVATLFFVLQQGKDTVWAYPFFSNYWFKSSLFAVCEPNPCQNGGVCHLDSTNYYCMCTPCFTGSCCTEQLCELSFFTISCCLTLFFWPMMLQWISIKTIICLWNLVTTICKKLKPSAMLCNNLL